MNRKTAPSEDKWGTYNSDIDYNDLWIQKSPNQIVSDYKDSTPSFYKSGKLSLVEVFQVKKAFKVKVVDFEPKDGKHLPPTPKSSSFLPVLVL